MGLRFWPAAATALSVLACCAFWIATGWADGASAALFAAVVGSFLAGLDDPLPAFRTFVRAISRRHCDHRNLHVWCAAADHDDRDADCRARAGLPAVRLDGGAARDRPRRLLLAISHPVQLALQSSYAAEFRFLRQLQRRAVGRRCAHGRDMRHRSFAWHRLDRKPAAAKQLANARRGRRTHLAARIASRSPVSCSIAWPCLPRASPWFPPRREATPPIFASCERR